MEGSESTMSRVGRAVWTVWGYLTGAVGRYLRPEVTNEETHNVHFKKEDTVQISKVYKELNKKKLEEETTESKTSERQAEDDLHYRGVNVRVAAIQWERGNIAHDSHDVQDNSKHSYTSSEGIDRKFQEKKYNAKALDNKSHQRNTHSIQRTKKEDSPDGIDADMKNQDIIFSGSKEVDLHVERNESNKEQINKLEEVAQEEEKILTRAVDETERNIKSELLGHGLGKENDLSVESSENSLKQKRKCEDKEEKMVEIMKRECYENEEEPLKNESIGQDLLTNEGDPNVERTETNLEQRKKPEEEDTIVYKEFDEAEEEPVQREFNDQVLLAKEADLNVQWSENSQEQTRKQEVEDEGVEIIRRLNEKTKEQHTETIDQGLVVKEVDLNVEMSESNQESSKKLEEEKKIMRREFDETEEELIKNEFFYQNLLTNETDLNVEGSENREIQRRKSNEEEEAIDQIMRREFGEAEEEPIKSEFTERGLQCKEDLNVEGNEKTQEQRMKSEERDVEIIRRIYDETEDEQVKSEFTEQDLLGSENLNVESNENNLDERKKPEEEILCRAIDETEAVIKSEFIDQGLVSKEVDLNGEMSESNQEQTKNLEEEEKNMRREFDETEDETIKNDIFAQSLLTKESDLNVEGSENSQVNLIQRRKSSDEEETVDQIMSREEEPIKFEFNEQGLLVTELDTNNKWNEKSQEQRRKPEERKEDVEEMSRKTYDETEEQQMKSEFIGQALLVKENLNVERTGNNIEGKGKPEEDKTIKKESIKTESLDHCILTEEVDLNLEICENSQELRRKQEGEEEGVKIVGRLNEKTKEHHIKNESIDQVLVANDGDLNVEMSENNQEPTKKLEEEEEIMRREFNETEEPIKNEFSDQSLLTKETDLNIEGSDDDNQEKEIQRKESNKEEETVVQLMRRELDEAEEPPIKNEFTEWGLLVKEDLIAEGNEKSQEQRRKSEEREEDVQEILRNMYDETEKEQVKSEFIEQALLASEADLNAERNENLEERRKPEEEGTNAILRSVCDETQEEPVKDKFIDHGLEQAIVCSMGDSDVVVSVEKKMECVNDEDKNDLSVVKQSNLMTAEHGIEARKSQMAVESLFVEMGQVDLNNVTLLEEQEMIDVEETKEETVRKAKHGAHERFSSCEQFKSTAIVEEQKGCDMKIKQIEVVERNVETKPELLEMAQIENAEIYKKVYETSRIEDEDNSLLQMLKSKDQKTTSDVALKAHDHNGSQQPALGTKHCTEVVITRPETETGNQTKTTSKFRAEVATVYAKKSAEQETSSHEQTLDKEERVLQEIMTHEQASLLEKSADTKENELSILDTSDSEIASVPLKQADETAVEFVDEIRSVLDECSIDFELRLEAKSNSPEKIAEVFEAHSEVTGMSSGELKYEQAQAECEISLLENNCHKSILTETPLEDQVRQNECTVQDSATEASSHILQIEISEAFKKTQQEILDMQRDSQGERTKKAELLNEIKDVTSCLGFVGEIAGGLTKESEDTELEMKAYEKKAYKSELESHKETSESNMNVEILNDTLGKELVAEKTDIESVVVSTSGEAELVKKLDEPTTEEKMEKCLGFSESDASNEINKENEEKAEHGETVVDIMEDIEERGKLGLKKRFEKVSGDNDSPPVLAQFLLPSQASSLDFTVQKSKIAVKNPLVRPPKDPRKVINMASVEPLTCLQPSQHSLLKKTHIEGTSVPSKGVIGFKLPGLGAGFPALRKTEAGRKVRDGEDSEKSNSDKQSDVVNVKKESSPNKPKWTPPRQPGMGSPLMMAELKSKLKKTVKE